MIFQKNFYAMGKIRITPWFSGNGRKLKPIYGALVQTPNPPILVHCTAKGIEV